MSLLATQLARQKLQDIYSGIEVPIP